MDFPEPDGPNGGYQPMTALRVLRKAAKVIERHMLKGTEPTADDTSDFINAVICSNSVEGIDS